MPKPDTINMQPIVFEFTHGGIASLKPNCGLKGAAVLHNWLPLCNSILWAAGYGCLFLLLPKLLAFRATYMDWNKNIGAVNPKRTLRMVLWSVGGFVGFMILIVTFAANDSSNTGSVPVQTVAPASTVSAKVSVGEEGYIKVSSPRAILANTKADFDDLIGTYVANDTMGIGQFLLDGRGVAVENGTRVLVIESKVGARKVRVLEGEQIGEAGWVAMEYVSKNK